MLTLPWFKHDLEKRKRPSTREFYIRRARRILPAYYVQLAMLFFVFLPLLNPTLWRAARGFVLANFGLHALFLHYTTPYSSASLNINGPLWTLAVEMQYYLLLPLIAVWFVRAPYVAAGAFLAAALIWKMLALHDLPLQAGEKVEVIIIVQSPPVRIRHPYPLRGAPVTYIDPTAPVADSDWEAAT